MYYHIAIETEQHRYITQENFTDKKLLLDDVIVPYLTSRGFRLNGYELTKTKISRFFICASDKPIEQIVNEIKSKNLSKNKGNNFVVVPAVVKNFDIIVNSDYTRDITSEIIKEANSQMDINHNQNISQDKEIINKIFIVHGHDVLAKTEVARFIEKLGLTAVILHEQVDAGSTIIEKLEKNTDVGFGVVLYTACDFGGLDFH